VKRFGEGNNCGEEEKSKKCELSVRRAEIGVGRNRVSNHKKAGKEKEKEKKLKHPPWG
jgi:hypothetical protein